MNMYIEERLTRKQKFTNNSLLTDVTLLKTISKYLSSVIGITNYLKSNERKVSLIQSVTISYHYVIHTYITQ